MDLVRVEGGSITQENFSFSNQHSTINNPTVTNTDLSNSSDAKSTVNRDQLAVRVTLKIIAVQVSTTTNIHMVAAPTVVNTNNTADEPHPKRKRSDGAPR